jgi:DNA-binding NtrC family response regulator
LKYEGYEITTAKSGAEAIEKFKEENFDCVLCDIKMPQMDGIEVLQKTIELNSDIPIIMVTGHGTIETAVESLRLGAYDFLEKPIDLNRLIVSIRNALEKKQLVKETKSLKQKINKSYEIIGNSLQIKYIKDLIDRVAPTEARVLITGENGTGKELVARQLHDKSYRAENPFIEVNCAAIPSELIESELFGHEKGAFTSAHKKREGKFELAHTGTIFLDEIGDMSLAAQAKVLRVLEENKIALVGGNKLQKIDVRVIAATNKNLKDEIQKGNFREDLYHRLSVIIVKMPTLNERIDDIPLLADHFINLIASEYNMPKKVIEEAAKTEMKKIIWTGNIREFRNVIERLMILCVDKITAEDVKRYALPIGY